MFKKCSNFLWCILRGFNFIETAYELFDNPSYTAHWLSNVTLFLFIRRWSTFGCTRPSPCMKQMAVRNCIKQMAVRNTLLIQPRPKMRDDCTEAGKCQVRNIFYLAAAKIDLIKWWYDPPTPSRHLKIRPWALICLSRSHMYCFIFCCWINHKTEASTVYIKTKDTS